MTTNQLSTFDFAPGMQLRAITKDAQPWFIAADVCAALDIKNTTQAVAELDDDDKAMQSIGLPGSAPWLVSEAGLYGLIFKSRKAEAKAFQKWVTATVLPTIRKEGIYIAGQEKPVSADMTMAELVAQMAALQAKVDAINTLRMAQYTAHQQEKLDRSSALKFFRRTPGRKAPTKLAIAGPKTTRKATHG